MSSPPPSDAAPPPPPPSTEQRPAEQQADTPAGEGPSTTAPPCEFIPSETWTGSKPGYYFSRGGKGLGYYVLVSVEERAAKAKEAAKAKPSVIKSRPLVAIKPQVPAAKRTKTDEGTKPKYLREMDTYRALSADSDKGSGVRPMLK